MVFYSRLTNVNTHIQIKSTTSNFQLSASFVEHVLFLYVTPHYKFLRWLTEIIFNLRLSKQAKLNDKDFSLVSFTFLCLKFISLSICFTPSKLYSFHIYHLSVCKFLRSLIKVIFDVRLSNNHISMRANIGFLSITSQPSNCSFNHQITKINVKK